MTKFNHAQRPVIWSIAGSDSGGGAGIQADLLTIHDLGGHGCTAITAITAQNSQQLQRVESVSVDLLRSQLTTLAEDMPPAVIKLGMLADASLIKVVAECVVTLDAKVVCDPVLAASTGGSLLAGDVSAFSPLWSCIDVLTPNVDEVEQLLGCEINTPDDIERAAKKFLELGVKSVCITGGHRQWQDCSSDYFYDGEQSFWLQQKRVPSHNSHGSGCSFASALATALALDYFIADALVIAKMYVTQGIRYGQQIGAGAGPVAHCGWPKALEDLPCLTADFESMLAQSVFADCDGSLGLYPVVDDVLWLERLLPLGITTIQLRIKDRPIEEIESQIQQAVLLQQQYGARLFINDYWQLAIKHGAYGVHLGQEDLDVADIQAIAKAGLRLGVSTHSYYEIARAHAIRPSYIAIGPIYSTTTKQMKFAEQGVQQLAEWVELLKPRYPLTAIGGINIERADAVLATGVESCAMVSAICAAEDYTQVVATLLAKHAS